MIHGLPCDQGIGFGDGKVHTSAMDLEGIKSSDNLLALISYLPSTGVYIGRDVTDFTLADGTITAASIDLSASGTKFVAIWTNAPDA